MSVLERHGSWAWRIGAVAIGLWLFLSCGLPLLRASLEDAADALQLEEAGR